MSVLTRKKRLRFKPADFENCDALFVEIWEDGEKTDDFRLEEDEDLKKTMMPRSDQDEDEDNEEEVK